MKEKIIAPNKNEINLLPLFKGIELNDIILPVTEVELAAAKKDLLNQHFIGFDTESKPVFKVGQTGDGPHVIQFSTEQKCYIFQSLDESCYEVVKQVLSSKRTVKVGFGLRSDKKYLKRKFNADLQAVLDLNSLFSQAGYRKELGLKAAIAVVFKQKVQKSKSVSTSNWALKTLKPNQLTYAANDAYAALAVFKRYQQLMKLSDDRLPIQ